MLANPFFGASAAVISRRGRGSPAAQICRQIAAMLAWVLLVLQNRTYCATIDAHDPSRAVSGLDVASGLEATLFAAEPMLVNPTNIDVDQRGRVWVCEVVNYRDRNGERPAGDRILILEDTDGDGKADKSTVFYQGRDIDAAMGICVLGNRVIVSASPNILLFTDIDGDGKADKKETLFTNTGLAQHDHSAHKFVFGPDGRLYWNFGNRGKAVFDKNGKPSIDPFGRRIVDDGKPFRGGMVFRCRLDGSELEVLGHNFRNPYEVAVDSFGRLWQSDNDDDGYRSTRLNFVLEYGNYGYRDEMTGVSWQLRRTNLEATIPDRHWHQNDPGVVPNLLITGPGAPSGLVIYEGQLLPSLFRGQLVYCDPGNNVVRACIVEPDRAGYRAHCIDLLRGTRDNWFRPSDISVAPDGSLIIADWYDPGVGGHRMGDTARGRIYRVSKPKHLYRAPSFDFATAKGAVDALGSPNLATRYLAWSSLVALSHRALPQLARVFEQSTDTRIRARALWLLATVRSEAGRYLAKAVVDPNEDVRATAVRVAQANSIDPTEIVGRLSHDSSPQVRRSCAIALRRMHGPKKAALWADLAAEYAAGDRWSLEALGIGADGDWDNCLADWLSKVGADRYSPAGRDIVWRSRATATAQLLAAIVEDAHTPREKLPRYLRAFDFLPESHKQAALVRLAFGEKLPASAEREFVMSEATRRIDRRRVLENPGYLKKLEKIVASVQSSVQFVDLIERFNLSGHSDELLKLAQQHFDDELGVRATRLLLSTKRRPAVAAALRSANPKQVERTLGALANAEDPRATPLLVALLDDETRPIDAQRQAVRALGRTSGGASRLLARAESGTLNSGLRATVAAAVHASAFETVRARAAKMFPLAPDLASHPLPSIPELARQQGDARRGRLVFATTGTCLRCHVVNGEGKEVGPNLSEIGAKLSKEALHEAILFPSAAINHDYATYALALTNGNSVSGILISRTNDAITLKGADAIIRTYAASDIEQIREQSISLMPGDLQKALTADDLVNLVEYLTTLKSTRGATQALAKPLPARPALGLSP
jgi:putative membrane-bound dehydrogenase-like protein